MSRRLFHGLLYYSINEIWHLQPLSVGRSGHEICPLCSKLIHFACCSLGVSKQQCSRICVSKYLHIADGFISITSFIKYEFQIICNILPEFLFLYAVTFITVTDTQLIMNLPHPCLQENIVLTTFTSRSNTGNKIFCLGI